MEDGSSRPVVIGCGIAGLAISKALSDGSVPHVLIGDVLANGPRPGESLDLVASIVLPRLFPTLGRFFHPKQRVVTYCGSGVLDCGLAVDKRWITRTILRFLGFDAPAGLMHVDRIGFDTALHELVSSSPFCERIPGRVTSLLYDKSADRISSLELDNGESIAPAYVFDASGPARLVARAAGLSSELLSKERRSIIAHFGMQESRQYSWLTRTTLVRLLKSVHGVSGAAWCVPLGQTISVGLGVESADTSELSDENLLQRAVSALAEVGVNIGTSVPLARSEARFTYSRSERAVGCNWLLVGPAYGSFWWPLSSGVGSALTAASLACEIIREPRRVAPLYQRYLDRIEEGHRRFDEMMTMDRAPDSLEELRVHFDPVIRGNLVRLAIHAEIVDLTWSAAGVSWAIQEFVGRRQVGSVTCGVRTASNA